MFFAFRWVSYTNISIEVMCDLYFVCGVALHVPVLYSERLKKMQVRFEDLYSQSRRIILLTYTDQNLIRLTSFLPQNLIDVVLGIKNKCYCRHGLIACSFSSHPSRHSSLYLLLLEPEILRRNSILAYETVLTNDLSILRALHLLRVKNTLQTSLFCCD